MFDCIILLPISSSLSPVLCSLCNKSRSALQIHFRFEPSKINPVERFYFILFIIFIFIFIIIIIYYFFFAWSSASFFARPSPSAGPSASFFPSGPSDSCSTFSFLYFFKFTSCELSHLLYDRCLRSILEVR